MKDKDRRVWDALYEKAAELELGGVYGLVGQKPEVARGVVMEIGEFGEDAVSYTHLRRRRCC